MMHQTDIYQISMEVAFTLSGCTKFKKILFCLQTNTIVTTKAALMAKAEAAEGRAPPNELPEGLDPHLMMFIALGREVEQQQAQNLLKVSTKTKERKAERMGKRGACTPRFLPRLRRRRYT